jgi:hypothetical protein
LQPAHVLDGSVIRKSFSHVAAAVAALAVLWLGIAYGSRAATGADAFGYVSQAYLWLQRDLVLEQPLSREFPWPHAEESLTPLGYRPGEIRYTIVPIYSPGLPLIMAAFDRAVGRCGPFYVAPIFGALLVLGTYLLALRITGSGLTASLAAILMAASPAFLFNLMFPMSDIVTASLWTWALALLTWPRMPAAAVAGCIAAAAVVVRPNLVPLAGAGAAAAALWVDAGTPTRRRALRAAAFAAAIVPAALFIGEVNRTLYGSPFSSGYGYTSSLYSLSHLWTNVRQFTTWLVRSESVLVLLAVLPLLSRRFGGPWTTARNMTPLLAVVALACASYLFYLPFDEWWYLRFLLPAFPILFLLLASAIVQGAGVIRRVSPAIVVAGALIVLVAFRVHFVASRNLLGLGYGEQRYAAVGQYIDRALPPNAVILTMQHSGSVRYYSGRLTIRHDAFSPGRFPSVIEWLQARGYRPYLLLEDWEEAAYREKFGRDTALGRLEMRVLAEMVQPVRIRLYDPAPYVGKPPPPDPIPIRPSRACLPPGGVWAAR